MSYSPGLVARHHFERISKSRTRGPQTICQQSPGVGLPTRYLSLFNFHVFRTRWLISPSPLTCRQRLSLLNNSIEYSSVSGDTRRGGGGEVEIDFVNCLFGSLHCLLSAALEVDYKVLPMSAAQVQRDRIGKSATELSCRRDWPVD